MPQTIPAEIVVFLLIDLFIFLYIALAQSNRLTIEKNKIFSLDKRLKENQVLFKTIFDQAPIGIAIESDKNHNLTNTNPMFEKITGRSKVELENVSWIDITHPDDIVFDLEKLKKFESGEIKGYDMEKRYVKPDGSIVWVHMTVAPLKFNPSEDYKRLCLIEDISKRKDMQKALHDSERSKSILLDNLPGMAYRCRYDRKWTIEFISKGCLALTGYKAESLLFNEEKSFSDLICDKYQKYLWNKWNKALTEKSKFKEEYEIITATGEIKWVYEQGEGVFDKDGNVLALEGLIIDITDQKKREMEITYLNEHDNLTGLFNRRFFDEEMKRLNQQKYLPLSVMIGNINGIRLINDALGYADGDAVIIETSEIIKQCCRKSDIIARTGGDGFSILLPNTDLEETLAIKRKIKTDCKIFDKYNKARSYSINISFGCSTKYKENDDIELVYKEAEDYMYRHKLLECQSTHSSIMTSVMATMYAKSQETEEHAVRLSQLSKMIGLKIGIPEESLTLLQLFAMLHDIGKIGVDDRILNKPGKLTEEEWRAMKKHPQIGYRIAMSTTELQLIAEYILTHHERWDGKGYPQGLAGHGIPLLSRILAVTDTFDAMTEARTL